MTDITNKNKDIARVTCILVITCLMLLFASPSPAQGRAPATAIIFPDIREPFRSIFLAIAKGIGDALEGNVTTKALVETDRAQDILAWIKQEDAKILISLGNHGFSMASELSESVPIVIGAVNMSMELQHGSYRGIVLNPDPASQLQRLASIAPKIKRVAVVYQRGQDEWMIERAMETARKLGLTLNAEAAGNLQEAANKYREILNNQASGTDALWLPQDSAMLDEQAVLPMILKEAWNKRLIVFSGNPSLVKRGVLFALYPDNYNMGRSLGEMARRIQASGYRNDGASQRIEPVSDLLIAVNIRTASHLGINYSREDLGKFTLIFPSR